MPATVRRLCRLCSRFCRAVTTRPPTCCACVGGSTRTSSWIRSARMASAETAPLSGKPSILVVAHASLQRTDLQRLRIQVVCVSVYVRPCACLPVSGGEKHKVTCVVWFLRKPLETGFCTGDVIPTSPLICRGKKEAQHAPSQLLFPELCSTTISALSSQ